MVTTLGPSSIECIYRFYRYRFKQLVPFRLRCSNSDDDSWEGGYEAAGRVVVRGWHAKHTILLVAYF